tara:strand:- start:172 stop:345 length:174 start_codon:yes stop_codon:yes gene_type:complete
MGIGFSEIWNGPSFLERGGAACRMRARDEAGKKKRDKSGKLKAREHFAKEWDKDLWD